MKPFCMENWARSCGCVPFRRCGGSRGFAILEALIATVLVVAGLLAVISFLNSATRVAADARTRTVATAFAEAGLQTLQGYLEVTDGALDSAANGCDEMANEAVHAVFNRCWWVDDSRAVLPITDPASSCTDGGYGDEPICWVSVRVEVSWLDRQAELQQVTLTSMLNASPPERGGLDLMRLVTHVEQPGSLPQWLVAAAAVEAEGGEGATDLVDESPGDGEPSVPVGGEPPPVTCLPWWGLEGEGSEGGSDGGQQDEPQPPIGGEDGC